MIDVLLIVVGVLVILAVFIDAVMTTLGVAAGSGPLTKVLLGRCWRLLMRFHTRDTESAALSAAGTVFLIVALLFWFVGLWAGWTLVFAGSDSVVAEADDSAATVAGLIYFTGFAIITLGTGSYTVTSDFWGIMTALASFTGFFLVTLSITYLIAVVTAVVGRRALAIQVNAMGPTPSAIVQLGWDGDRFTDLYQQQLVDLTPTVALSAEQHLAYPVLHYFHSTTGDLASPLAMANLDEALMLLGEVVDPEHRPDRTVLDPLRFAIERYLSTASGTAWTPESDTPPAPALSELDEAGIPLVTHDQAVSAIEARSARRTTLSRLVNADGWSWPVH